MRRSSPTTDRAPLGATPAAPNGAAAAPAVPVAGRPRNRVALALEQPRAQSIGAFAVYLLYALAITWPWAIKPTSTVYGVIGGDLTGGITRFRELAEERQAPFLPGELPDLNAPYGVDVQWALQLISLPSELLQWLMSMAFGAVAANGVLVLIGFVGCSFSMFLLTRWVTGSAGGAFVAGVAFGFWPYVFSTASQGLGHGWVLVILVWRMLVVLEKPTARNGVWAGLAVVFAVAWIHYWLLIGGVLFGLLGLGILIVASRRGTLAPTIKALAVACAVLTAWLAVVVWAGFASGFADVPERDPRDAIAQSARPLMWVTPSPFHPVFGRVTHDFLYERFTGPGGSNPQSTAVYTPIYLGLSLLALAAIGAFAGGITRLRQRIRDWDRAGAGTAFSLLLIPIAMAFTAPPYVQGFGVSIPMPARVITEFTDIFRATSRFTLLMMLGLCILAAFGVARLLRGRSFRAQAAIVGALAVVVAVDLWNSEPPRPEPITFPKLYDVLKAQPKGTVVEYPLYLEAEAGTNAIFAQSYHGHRTVNGYLAGTVYESMAMELQALTDPHVVPELARMGVDYVLLRSMIIRPHGIPRPGRRIEGLQYITSDKFGGLYKVVAKPAKFAAHARRGFALPEVASDGRRYRWMRKPTGELGVSGDCSPCRGELVIKTYSFGVARTLTLTDVETGKRVWRGEVGVNYQTLRIPLEFDREILLRADVTPDPISPNSLNPASPDKRTLAIQFDEPLRFVETP